MDLSIIIAARNERYLKPTIEDVLRNTGDQTEIIAIVDGEWPDEPLEQHPRLHVIREPVPVGQRAAVNLGARLSDARYVCKLDAHVSIKPGFDTELIRTGDELGHDVTQIPRLFHLHVFNWKCQRCGVETYQGNTPTACATCAGSQGGPFERVWIWERRGHHWRKSTDPQPKNFIYSDFWRFDSTLHFQYFPEYRGRPASQGDVCDVMTALGACFFMRRERFIEIGGLDEQGGIWGQFGVEIALKSALSGGRHVVNKRTWMAHLFRTKGGEFGFPYALSGHEVDQARAYSRSIWMNNAWPMQVRTLRSYVEQFSPVPDWTPEKIAALPSKLRERAA